MRSWRAFALLVLAFSLSRALACGGSASCAGDPLPGGLPVSEERVGAVQVRLTQAGLRWLGDHAAEILSQFVPDGLAFTIRESSQLGGTVVVCPSDVRPQGCPFRVALNEARIEPAPPERLLAHLFLDVPRQQIPLRIFGSDCEVTVEAARTPVDVGFDLGLDPATRALDVVPVVQPIAGTRLSISGNGLCATVAFFRDFLLGEMRKEIQKNVSEALEDQLCTACTEGCPPASACGARDLCRHASGRCVARRQGVAGAIDLARLLGGVATQRPAVMRYGIAVGGSRSVDSGGATIGGMGGAGAEPSSCVPPAPERQRSAVPAPALPSTAPDGNPYHVALALSRELVEDLAAAAWRSGAMCLRATSQVVRQLTSDAFSLVLPVLHRLTEGRSRPVILAVRLEAEPRVRIGSGTSHVDARGQVVLDEPLLALTLPALVLELYTLVEDRMVRIGVVRQDVTLPLGLDVTADGRIAPLLGDTTGLVQNVAVTDAEILGGTAASLRDAVPTLVALALPLALGSLRPFDVPTFSGFAIEPRGVRGEGPAGALTHAVIYADLALAPPPRPSRAVARTSARIASVRPGLVEMELGGGSPTGEPLEWSFRLDGPGPWSPFTPSRRVWLDDARLWLLGEHWIEVRARVRGRPKTLDPTPAAISFRIEPSAAGPPARPATGCTAAGPSGALGAALALLWILRRRRG